MSRILILSINNITNYLFAKHILEETDYNITCLVIDEPINIVENVVESLAGQNSDRITLIETSLKEMTDNYQIKNIRDQMETCDYAFLDTHYWRHAKPEVELQEWNLLTSLINHQSIKFKRLLITSYEDTRTFAKKSVEMINGFILPHWDSRAEGINKLVTTSLPVIFIYPSLYYDEFFNLVKPITQDSNTDYTIKLPLTANQPFYAINRDDYVKLSIKLLNRNIETGFPSHFYVTGEKLDLNFISCFVEQCFEKTLILETNETSPDENNCIDRIWHNYFIINTKHHDKEIIRDHDLTRFILPNLTCFYNWLKQKSELQLLYQFRHQIFNCY